MPGRKGDESSRGVPGDGGNWVGQRGRPGDGDDRPVYVISVAAELAGVHPQTLRIYERRGLLDPVRTGGGSRRYSAADIAQLRRIQVLTSAGVNLEGVRRLLRLEAELTQLGTELARVRVEARAALDAAHRQYRRDLVPLRAERLPLRWRPAAKPQRSAAQRRTVTGWPGEPSEEAW